MAPRTKVHSAWPMVSRRSAGSRGAAAATAATTVHALQVPSRRTTCKEWRAGDAARAASSGDSQPGELLDKETPRSHVWYTWRLLRPVTSGHDSTSSLAVTRTCSTR